MRKTLTLVEIARITTPKAPHLYPKPKQYRCPRCGARNPTRICTAPFHNLDHPEIRSLYITQEEAA